MTDGIPATGTFGVGIGVGVGLYATDGGCVGLDPDETRQSSEDTQTLLLSRTRQEKLLAPLVDTV